MGTDCAPWLANLTLLSYEFHFLIDKLRSNQISICINLSHCFRYIDDITVINDNDDFEKWYKTIYPSSLTLKKVNTNSLAADVLDISVNVIDNVFSCKLFDKRNTFPFKCNVFPDIKSNIAQSCKYNIFHSQLLRFFNISSDTNALRFSVQCLLKILTDKNYDIARLKRIGNKFINKKREILRLKFTNNELKEIVAEFFR